MQQQQQQMTHVPHPFLGAVGSLLIKYKFLVNDNIQPLYHLPYSKLYVPDMLMVYYTFCYAI